MLNKFKEILNRRLTQYYFYRINNKFKLISKFLENFHRFEKIDENISMNLPKFTWWWW